MVNVEMKFENEDFRPPFILEDVRGASFTNVKAQHAAGIPTFVLRNVTDFTSSGCGTLPDNKIDRADNLKL